MTEINRIAIASDSFKGSLSSMQVADCAAEAVKSLFPDCEIVKVNVADGGEGTIDALIDTLGGSIVTAEVMGPLMRPVIARYGVLADGKTAVMEMAAASGLVLIAKEERNPLKTTTYGTGQMIMDALARGCRKFLVGIGGSATNDGGTGMLSALGVKFRDAEGNLLEGCGESLERIACIDMDGVPEAVRESEFIIACDVDTPFCGPNGAAYVFAPQKGADAAMVERLDKGMRSFAALIRDTLHQDIADLPGAGAAGGIGGGFRAFLGATLLPGIEMVLDTIDFDRIIKGCDLVITGEGKMDFQTAMGKTPAGILKRAKAQNIPVLAIGGCVEPCGSLSSLGFMDMAQVTPEGMPLETAMRTDIASDNVKNTIVELLKKHYTC